MSIATELTLLANSKQAIKNSINQKGGSITDSTPFADYSTAIDNLPIGGSGNPLLTSIDVSDFTGTTFGQVGKYVTRVTIPSGVTNIGNFAFQNCTSLTSVTIPSSVTSIAQSALQGCTSLTSVTIPDSVTSIGRSLLANCSSLTSVTLSNNLTSIAEECFGYCTSLTSVTIPSSVTSIAQFAFRGCSSLTGIEFPSTVTNIGWASFNDCSSLKSIIVNATTPPTLGNAPFSNTNNCPIYVPTASVDTYKAASGWSDYASRIVAIPSPSITIVEYIGQSNPADIGEFVGCNGTLQIDAIPAASENSTFDSDIKASGLIIVEDNNGNDVTSQCTFSSNDYYKWDTSQDPSYDGESPVQYFWVLDTDIGEADAQNPHSATITATYGNLSDTFTIEWTTTSNCEEPEPEPEPDPEEPEE